MKMVGVVMMAVTMVASKHIWRVLGSLRVMSDIRFLYSDCNPAMKAQFLFHDATSV